MCAALECKLYCDLLWCWVRYPVGFILLLYYMRNVNYCYDAWMTTFSQNPYFIIFQPFECYTTLIVKELLCNKK